MQEKQGEEDMKIIKEEEERTEKYILKKNRLTFLAIGIIIVSLIIIGIALVMSGTLFSSSA